MRRQDRSGYDDGQSKKSTQEERSSGLYTFRGGRILPCGRCIVTVVNNRNRRDSQMGHLRQRDAEEDFAKQMWAVGWRISDRIARL